MKVLLEHVYRVQWVGQGWNVHADNDGELSCGEGQFHRLQMPDGIFTHSGERER